MVVVMVVVMVVAMAVVMVVVMVVPVGIINNYELCRETVQKYT